ncbi:MAG: Gfo/Idh/MocA family oxidoreductase [Planctomycetota bacterium]
MTTQPLRIGFIGAGFVGQVAHLRSFAELAGHCEIVAIAETRPQLRAQVATRYSIPRSYPSHEELLRAPDIDAVVAILPRPLTGPVALAALQAGKPLLTEKPMAATAAQGDTLVAAAKRYDVPHAVGYMRQHDAGIEFARQTIADCIATGELGAITYARSHCFQGNDYCAIDGFVDSGEPRSPVSVDPAWPIAPDWVPEPRKAEYASFLNVYCHNLNLLRFLLGDFERVVHADLRPAARAGDAPTGLVSFDHGSFRSLLEVGSLRSEAWHEVTEVFFERGKVTIHPPPAFLRNVAARVEVLRCDDSDTVETHTLPASWAFQRQAAAFVEDVRAGATPRASSQDALIDLQWAERIWELELANNAKSNAPKTQEIVSW